jgi:hypothetical protein
MHVSGGIGGLADDRISCSPFRAATGEVALDLWQVRLRPHSVHQHPHTEPVEVFPVSSIDSGRRGRLHRRAGGVRIREEAALC